jgi:molybdate-binding protein/DNA-binding XRE family transcriptional regulator
MLKNDVKTIRTRRGWSQGELARRAGLSRAGVSAIELGRLVPSTAAALALAAALGCKVEALFRLTEAPHPEVEAGWAWPPGPAPCRYWRAHVTGRRLLYPVEYSPLGLIPHDGVYRDGAFHDHGPGDPPRTLVLATCDPAVGLLAAELARLSESVRLIVLPRSSRAAIDLLAQGLVHAAGIHLARSELAAGNARAAGPLLEPRHAYHLLRVADWDDGIALAPGLRLKTVKSVVDARLRWVGREPGSGAQQCLAEILGGSRPRHPVRLAPVAFDHRGVAQAIRSRWADAGICVRLASDEANLSFLSVRQEAYDICFANAPADDPCVQSLVNAVRSSSYRRALAELPGYDTGHTGALERVKGQRATSAKPQ